MHQVTAFKQNDTAELKKLATSYPLATVVVETSDGVKINHIPLIWVGTELHGHVARGNELVTALKPAAKGCLATAIFHGPNAYVSPSDYPSKAVTGEVVPTWNYAVAHLSGVLRLRDEPRFLRQQIDQLTAGQEEILHPEDPWTLEDTPASYAVAVQQAIVGIALSIESATGKYKLSQNRTAEDHAGARAGLEARGDGEIAALMRAKN